jgi:hypothetical protein
MIHLGDNLLKKTTLEYATPIIKEEYAARYHYTWNRWSSLLCGSSHLMIPDDHEIVYNYKVGTTSDPVAEIAFDTIEEYQHALLISSPEKPYRTTYWIGDTLIYMCTRIYTADAPINTSVMLDLLKQAKNATTLIVCLSTAPLFHLSGWRGWVIDKFYSVESVWTDDKLILLYDTLFSWMQGDAKRKVILVGGDLHIGVVGKIRNNNQSIPLYVTSPISYHPTPILGDFYASSLKGCHQLISHTNRIDYTLDISETYSIRNYLLMNLDDDQVHLEVSTETSTKNFWEMLQNIFNLTKYTAGTAGQ